MKRFVLFRAMAMVFGAALLLALEPAWALDENTDGIDDRAAAMHRWGIHGLDFIISAQLTEAQRSELQTQLDALKTAGKTNAEIAAALLAQLQTYGVTLSDDFKTKVTQRAAARDLVDQMKAEGASRAEIKAALEAAGYDLGAMGPDGGHKGRGFGQRGAGEMHRWGINGFDSIISAELTQAQQSELQTQLDALKAAGKTNADIAVVLLAQLQTYGVTLSDDFKTKVAQQAAGRDLVDQMKAEGASRAEIKAALEAAGYDPGAMGPADGGGGRRGRGFGHRGAGERHQAPAGGTESTN